MVCKFCGHHNEPGVKFCARCGAQLQQQQQTPPVNNAGYGNAPPDYRNAPPPPAYGNTPPSVYGNAPPPDLFSKPQKALPIKKILMIAIPVIVIVIAAIIIIPMLGGGGSSAKRTNSISFFSDGRDTVVSGNNNAAFTIDGEYGGDYEINLAGDKAAILTDYSSDRGGTLWYVTPTAATEVAEDVFAFTLSDSGGGIAYFTEYDDADSIAELNLYDTSSKNATLVSNEAMYEGYGDIGGVALSPDGKSIGYVTDYDNENRDFTGNISINGGAAEELDDLCVAFAISNGGKYIYYVQMDSDTGETEMFVRSGDTDESLADGLSSVSMMLTADYSEALFSYGSRTYISRRGGEAERVRGAVIYNLLLPRYSQTRSHSVFGDVYVYALSTFANFTATTDEGIAYYDSKLTAIEAPDSYSAAISGDGKTLYYINDSYDLMYTNPSVDGAEETEIDRDVSSFVVAGNDAVYYIDDDGELFYARGSSEPVSIYDDVSSLSVSPDGSRCFFLIDYREGRGGELNFSSNGGEAAPVEDADEVMRVWSTATSVFYVNSDDELYRSSGNERFTLFMEDYEG